jgi:hypothetical protein
MLIGGKAGRPLTSSSDAGKRAREGRVGLRRLGIFFGEAAPVTAESLKAYQ